ncbi:MAG TPA: SigE family RNA polymerase sigma factor [Aquihabitans sp.]|nr:SigE family RNA polymerase sigma factor [Aquihabitans sp.]
MSDHEAPGAPAGDFEELFDRERRPMVRLAFLLVGDERVAEELVQEAFAAVFLRWDRLDRPGAYLRRCVVNGARTATRRRSLERRHLRAVADDGEPSPARELLDALAALSPERRAVVVLRFYESLTQEEIAEALGIRLGTVKSRLHRGLAELREALA